MAVTSLTYIAITGDFVDGSDQALDGTVTFTPSEIVYASGVPVTSPNTPIQAQITNGQLRLANGGTVQLLAQGNTGLSLEGPTGFWFWTVSLQYTGSVQVTDGWSFQLATSPTSVDLYSTRNTPTEGSLTNPMTTLGDMIDGGTAGTPQRLAGPTSASLAVLTSTGTGTSATLPSWQAGTSLFDPAGTASSLAAAGSAYTQGFALPIDGGTMKGWLAPNVATLTFGTAITPDAGTANAFNLNITGTGGSVSAPLNPSDGQVIRFRLYQGGTASNSLAWGTIYDFGTTGVPSLSGTAKTDILGFEYDAFIGAWCFVGSGPGF